MYRFSETDVGDMLIYYEVNLGILDIYIDIVSFDVNIISYKFNSSKIIKKFTRPNIVVP